MPNRVSVGSLPAFRGLWLATAAGDAARTVAVFATSVILTVTLNASAFEVGLASPLSNAGALCFGLVAGSCVDHWGAKRTLVAGVWVRFAAYGLPALAWAAGWLSGWQLLLCVLAASIADTFYAAAHAAILPDLVGRSHVSDAAARLQATDQIIWLLGPSAAGAVVRWVSGPALLVVSAVGQILALTGLRRLPAQPPRASAEAREGFGESVRTGLRFLLQSRWIGAIALAASLNNAAAGFLGSAEAVFILRDLHLSASVYGVVTAVSGVGGIVGAVIAPRLGRRVGPVTTLMAGACTMPFAFAILPLAAVFASAEIAMITCAAVAMFLFGMCIGLFGVSSAGLTARLTPKSLLARVSSTRRMFTQGATVVGGLLGAMLSQAYGSLTALIIAVVVACTQVVPLMLCVGAARPHR